MAGEIILLTVKAMNIINTKRAIKPLPFIYYFGPVLLLTTAGLIDSVYLSISHYRVYTDIGYSSFCAISQSLNCDTVSQSPYSILFNVPIPIWGVLGYSILISLLIYGYFKHSDRGRIWALLFFLTLSFSLISIALAYVSTKFIRTLCIMCMLSYSLNFAITFYCWLIYRRFNSLGLLSSLKEDLNVFKKQWEFSGSLVTISAALTVFMVVGFPSYWKQAPMPKINSISTGVTADGHPWIGAAIPELTIEEYSDYQCFQCRKMHHYLRQLVALNQDRIRLVHRHYPMDHQFNPIVKEPFHLGSGNMALLAIFATERGKFWEMNDFLFNLEKKQSLGVRQIFTAIHMDGDLYFQPKVHQELVGKLYQDIKEGLEHKIDGTPSFVINGEVYVGNVPTEILSPYLN